MVVFELYLVKYVGFVSWCRKYTKIIGLKRQRVSGKRKKHKILMTYVHLSLLTVCFGLLSAPEYKPHQVNLKRK